MITITPTDFSTIVRQYSLTEEQLSALPNWRRMAGVDIYVKGGDDGAYFDRLLPVVLRHFSQRYEIGMHFAEPFVRPQSRIRSHRKLFQLHRHRIGEMALSELEVAVEDQRSILAACIDLQAANFAFVTQHLLNSQWVCGLIRLAGNAERAETPPCFLDTLVSTGEVDKALFRWRLPNFVDTVLQPSLVLLHLTTDATDRRRLQLIGLPDDLQTITTALHRDLQDQLRLSAV